MAQASRDRSTITSEAYDLLDCFVSELDDVIYDIAESIAKSKNQLSGEGIVEISQDDIREAANTVFDAIKSQAGNGISEETVRQIEAMHACVMAKCRIR